MNPIINILVVACANGSAWVAMAYRERRNAGRVPAALPTEQITALVSKSYLAGYETRVEEEQQTAELHLIDGGRR